MCVAERHSPCGAERAWNMTKKERIAELLGSAEYRAANDLERSMLFVGVERGKSLQAAVAATAAEFDRADEAEITQEQLDLLEA